MTGAEFIQFQKDIHFKMQAVTKAKNTDYSGGGDSDAFNNFMMVEKMGISSAESGFLVRMTDKMMRITNLIKNGGAQVKDEAIEDTLMDLANYAVLMMGYLESKKKGRSIVAQELFAGNGRKVGDL